MIRATLTILLALTGAATAQSVDRDTARAQLFDADGVQVAIIRQPFLTETDISTLQAMPQVAQLNYYGALAANPASGFQSEATRGAFNFHSIEQARAAALSACGAGCVLVAEIRPRGYQDGRRLTLNQDATRAVTTRAFNRAGRDAAVAISRSTGSWGLGNGAADAINTCAGQGARDCEVAVGR